MHPATDPDARQTFGGRTPILATPEELGVSKRLAWIALAGVAFQAFFAINDLGRHVPNMHPEYGTFVAMIAMAFAGARPWRELAAHPAVRLLGVLAAFLIVHAAYIAWLLPEVRWSNQLTVVAKLLRLGFQTCVIGWWMSVNPRAIPKLLGVLVLGLLAAVLYHMPWSDMPGIWAGEIRPRFGISQNLSGMIAAVGGWLTLCLLIGIWRDYPTGPRRTWLLVLALLAFAGCFCVLLFSQSRGAWLSFLVAVPLAIIGYALTRGRRRRPLPWQPILLALLVCVLLLTAAHRIFALRFDGADQLVPSWVEALVSDRTAPRPHEAPATLPPAPAAADAPPANAVAPTPAADPRALPTEIDGLDTAIPGNKAVGIRMLIYRMGVERFQERPWFGWGLDTIPLLIERAHLPTGGEQFVHLHNAYLDALVGLGVIGAALLFAVFAMLMRELWLAWRTGIVSTASFWGLAGCVGIVLIANNFDSLLWRFEYVRAPLGLLFGCCMAYGLIRERRAREG
ncbi:O-antigen ligase family protein [Lysobacter auxotrophicus]|uniref:O-antigen ligase family protein n=1 Tax=Lysobacter auxotrophicus TaxID=2992573 RepID=A0ABN6UKV7_9GAMM|nr:O-antigen ligase family protein [Lysobacter auxotrophicus]BDU16930.1 O-antigen ligase family protein [Lysobacter auxotrophicus]